MSKKFNNITTETVQVNCPNCGAVEFSVMQQKYCAFYWTECNQCQEEFGITKKLPKKRTP